MLEAALRKKRNISHVYREGNGLYLTAEAGVIRILPQTERIIRISYTENGGFDREQGQHLLDLSGSCPWEWQEESHEISVTTQHLRVSVDRLSGSVRFEKRDGTLLMAERDRESKTVEAFDTYRMMVNENTRVEEIKTPGGVKRRVTEADKVFDRKMYHTRLYLEFDHREALYGMGQKTFDKQRFPDPEGMIRSLHDMDVHFMISVWPNMTSLCDNYQEFSDKGLLLPATQIYDAFSQEGRNMYWEQAQKGLFRYGVDAWWCDSSEPVTPEWNRVCKPEPGDMYREFVEAAGNCMEIGKANVYGLYHARAVYEGQRGCQSSKRVMNLTRSGYAGSQKYGTVLWSGDISASWDTLKKQIAAGLHFCASGLPYWTLDIGAFFVKKGEPWFWDGEYDDGTEDYGYRELYVRWFQFGAFLPIFRSHGTDCRREPWNFGRPGEMFYDALMAAIRLRYSLLPYIYSQAAQVWREDGTIMRLLAFDFSEDRKAACRMDQYMFGPSLMVCPVTEPMYYRKGSGAIEGGGREKTVYLPAGTDWYDLRTGEKYTGGREVTVGAGIESIPVFVKAGAVITFMKPGDSTAQMRGKDILIRAYAGADGKFCLYEDAGDGYGYENGEYCLTYFEYCDRERKVTWRTEGNTEFRKGDFLTEIVG